MVESSLGNRTVSGGLLSSLKKLDAYPKVNEDFLARTLSGGIISLVASIIMVLLFLSEFRLFLTTQTIHELSVDTGRGETIPINIDITFPHMPCSWLGLDAMDVSGDMHLDVDHELFKQRLSSTGKAINDVERHDVAATKTTTLVSHAAGNATCGSCYGAEDTDHPCCNTCNEVRQAYARRGWVMEKVLDVEQCKHDDYLLSLEEQQGEGCHMWGKLEVNKVAGNFHFAAGRSLAHGSQHMHDMVPFLSKTLDFTHTIHSIGFGAAYPGMKNPLDGVKSAAVVKAVAREAAAAGDWAEAGEIAKQVSGLYQYFLKVVPTVYTRLDNSTISTNQYSVTEHYQEAAWGPAATASPRSAMHQGMPGVFFYYDLSPIKVRIVTKRSSFLTFLTSVCAIVGGVFTVSGLIDGFVYQAERVLRKKNEIGKLY